MQSLTAGFSATRLVVALSLALGGVTAFAQETKAQDHTAHHPADAASASKTAPQAEAQPPAQPAQSAPMGMGAKEKMARMDTHMKAMKEAHQKFMAAKTAQERKALMPEHMKAMRDAMAMMNNMRASGTSEKGAMGMMGGEGKGAMMEKMPMEMMSKHQMMEKRMEMMESMMQMMMDRMQMGGTP